MNARITRLTALGQSLWYDNIRRSFLLPGGEMAEYIREGAVRGVTSNPTIFEKAVAESSDYDAVFARHAGAASDPDSVYLELASDDIRTTAELLLPVYEATHGVDGYVSMEVSPHLAGDTAGTVAEALKLSALLSCPNLMIKVPGTDAGVPAIRELTRLGISVNVTLLFNLRQYTAIAEAWLEGLEARLADGKSVRGIASVASFFVSRVDSLVDKQLQLHHPEAVERLRGKAAIANAKLAYLKSQELFGGERWARLKQEGAQVQRLLWASTGTKDPRYSDTLYVDTLIGPETVNTVPPATLRAFLDHGTPAATLAEGLDEAQVLAEELRILGLDLEAIGEQLQQEGVVAFEKSMKTLVEAIRRRLHGQSSPDSGGLQR